MIKRCVSVCECVCGGSGRLEVKTPAIPSSTVNLSVCLELYDDGDDDDGDDGAVASQKPWRQMCFHREVLCV